MKTPQRGPWWAIAKAVSVGLTVSFTMVVGGGMGFLLDWLLGTGPWFTLGGGVLGGVAGLRHAYRMIQQEME